MQRQQLSPCNPNPMGGRIGVLNCSVSDFIESSLRFTLGPLLELCILRNIVFTHRKDYGHGVTSVILITT